MAYPGSMLLVLILSAQFPIRSNAFLAITPSNPSISNLAEPIVSNREVGKWNA